MKNRITISRRNGTGVQELQFNELKAGEIIILEEEKYWIETTAKKRGKKWVGFKYSNQPNNKV
jgi:hypothetical protein